MILTVLGGIGLLCLLQLFKPIPSWAVVVSLLAFVGLIFGVINPLARARDRAAAKDDDAYRKSLDPTQPWQK